MWTQGHFQMKLRMGNKARFENEAKRNSEMAYP